MRRKTWRKKARSVAAVILAAAFMIPNYSGAATSATETVKKITLKNPAIQTLALKKGETFLLRTNQVPKRALIKYSSSKKKVVSVSKTGKLKALSAGKAKITIRGKKGNAKVVIQVTVYKKFVKAKKVNINRKTLSLSMNATASAQITGRVSTKKATIKKVKYVTADSSIVSVDNRGKVTAKKAGTTKVYAYAADGRGAKASCKVTVTAATRPTTEPTATTGVAQDTPATTAPQATASIVPSATPEATYEPTATPKATKKPLEKTPVNMITDGKVAMSMYMDASGNDYDGLSLIAKAVQNDFALVAGVEADSPDNLQIETSASELKGCNTAIIAGSIGNNDVIDQLIQSGKIDVSDIKDKWETYTIQLVDNPVEGVDKGIVICGSDKRGTIYGMFHMSEAIGVSPWVYWGDAAPEVKKNLTLGYDEFGGTSSEPSVKYRGIFLNDEAPSLTSYVKNKYGNYNEKFYQTVYELILRLKGNYLWPAMWSNAFSEDGTDAEGIANAKLADEYGIVMGTSHHEPCARAGIEWGREYKNYGSSQSWNFDANTDAITKFWEDGIKRNGAYENVFTVGMRGESDSALEIYDTTEENIDYLKRVITSQKKLLNDNKLSSAPTMFAIYKEIETYWNEGLRDWDGMDGITAMLSDDNFGNVRSLPTAKYRDRKGGWGMYYHFDYHGAPTSYEWENTISLNKIWDQMTKTYEAGVDEIWIVNVGDLKPMETPISYFMDLAYDYDTWSDANQTAKYSNQWVAQQFSCLSEEETKDVASIIDGYTLINGNRKPEVLKTSTYSVENYNEAMEQIVQANNLIAKADQYKDLISEDEQAAYYQLVYYPAVASANVVRIQLYAALNQMYYKQGNAMANLYGTLLMDCTKKDKELTDTYNNNMPGVGTKWKGMMSSAHIGFTEWNTSKNQYPSPKYVSLSTERAGMTVSLENSTKAVTSGNAVMDSFTNLNKESYYFVLSNTGVTPYDYTVSPSDDWIQVSKKSGTVISQDTITVSIDWSKVKEDKSGTILVTGAGKEVTIQVQAECLDISGLEKGTYVEAHNYVSMAADGFSKNVNAKNWAQWNVIENYGRTGASLKLMPSTKQFKTTDGAPYVEYTVSVTKDGEYTLNTYAAPSNNSDYDDVSIYYAVAVDGKTPSRVNSLCDDYESGTWKQGTWASDVTNNIRITSTKHTLTAGTHKIRIYAQDSSFVLQKLVLYRTADGLKSSYLGPQESYQVGKEGSQNECKVYEPEAFYNMPGTLPVNQEVTTENSYDQKVALTSDEPLIISMDVTSSTKAELEVLLDGQSFGTVEVEKSGAYEFSTRETVTTGTVKLEIKAKSGQAQINDITIRKSSNWALAANSSSFEATAGTGAEYLGDGVRLYASSGQNYWKSTTFPASTTVSFDGEKSVKVINLISWCSSNVSLDQSTVDTKGYLDKFTIEYWDGANWAVLDTVSENQKVWYQLNLKQAVKTSKLRISFNEAVRGNQIRLVELEAWE